MYSLKEATPSVSLHIWHKLNHLYFFKQRLCVWQLEVNVFETIYEGILHTTITIVANKVSIHTLLR